MLDKKFYWIKRDSGDWQPAEYLAAEGISPQRFVTMQGKRLLMTDVLLIGQPLIPPDAREVTVRDQFAMAALPEVCRESAAITVEQIQKEMAHRGVATAIEMCAQQAYEMADAMMKAREGK